MKILLFSDLHLHTWKYGSKITPEGYNSRLIRQYGVLNQIGNYAFDNDIKHVFFLGDLFHTHSQIPTQALSLAHNAFWWFKHKFNLQSYFLVGNHDMMDREGKIHSVGWLREYGTVIEKQTTFKIDNQIFHALPYTEDEEKIKNFLSEILPGAIVLMHQGVAGIPMGSGFVIDEVLSPEMIPEHCKHAFTGHYHAHKCVNEKFTVIGSPMQHTWGDVGDARGWIIYNTETNEVKQIQQTVASEFRILDLEGASYLAGGLPINVPIQANFIRVINWKGDRDELRKQLIEAGAEAVEFELDKSLKPDTNIFQSANFSVKPILDGYDKMKMTKRRKEIGKQVRDLSYEII